jgi:IS30 family transposase
VTVGHWKLDIVVSSRGKSKTCVTTFGERKTRLYLAVKMSVALGLTIRHMKKDSRISEWHLNIVRCV